MYNQLGTTPEGKSLLPVPVAAAAAEGRGAGPSAAEYTIE